MKPNPVGACIVCFDSFPLTELWAMRDCPAREKHCMCQSCATGFFISHVTEGRVENLQCPLFGNDDCSAVASEEDVRSLLSPGDFAKYGRFKAFAEDPTLRECPVCFELVKPEAIETDGEEGPNVQPDMCCSNGHRFCYYHSNAHPPGREACEAFAQAEAKHLHAAITASGAKACPNCGIFTTKSEGCNHMRCPTCKAGWCWICGRKLDGKATTGWHYNPANPVGCLQFTDVSDPTRLRDFKMALVRTLALPGTILGLLSFWGPLPLWFLCVGIGISVFLVLASLCAWLPVGFLCTMVLYPLDLNEEHLVLLTMAPWFSCWASVECVFGSME